MDSGYYFPRSKKNPDDVSIFMKVWDVKNPRAIVTFVHGLGEHVMRYDHVFQEFNKSRIRVLGFDQRGFGRTAEANKSMVLGDAISWETLMDDILNACKENEETVDGGKVPHFLMGHSMGGLEVLRFALERKSLKFSGLISSAPAIQPLIPVPTIKRTLANWFSKIIGSFNTPTDLDSNLISRDKSVVDAYNSDPLVHKFVSLRTGIN
jgi:acylglycerol lipase